MVWISYIRMEAVSCLGYGDMRAIYLNAFNYDWTIINLEQLDWNNFLTTQAIRTFLPRGEVDMDYVK